MSEAILLLQVVLVFNIIYTYLIEKKINKLEKRYKPKKWLPVNPMRKEK